MNSEQISAIFDNYFEDVRLTTINYSQLHPELRQGFNRVLEAVEKTLHDNEIFYEYGKPF